MELDCQGPDCEEDLNRSYYSALNGKYDYPARFPARGETSLNRRYSEDGNNEDGMYTRYATFPFKVRGNGPEEYDFPRRRVTRTSTSTTSSPSGWVQLSPRPSEKNTYDPFFAKGDNKDLEPGPKAHNEDKLSSSQFQNRLGVELNPDTFAARWGWGQKSGTRIPDWLEKLNEQYASLPDVAIRRPSPTRDEDPKNWVKLEPVPVSGVSISKWVPKGTHASELPTTGNNVRNKPHAWWDSPVSSVKKPTYGIKNSNMGWGSSNDYDSLYTKRPSKPGNAWQDVIYPDTPGSATTSWETTSDILKGSQRFPSNSGWKSENTVRGPVASWTAPGGGTNRNYHHRRPTNNYPDLQSGDDDPRWVLISNSRHSTPSESSLSHRYRPNPNRWRLDLLDRDRHDIIDHDYEPHEGPTVSFQRRRAGKEYKAPEKSAQDQAFERVNFTLQHLKPILSFDGGDEGRALRRPSLNGTKLTTTTAKTTTTTTTTTTKRPGNQHSTVKDVFVQPPRRKSLLSALIGDGRQATVQAPTAQTVNGTKLVPRKGNSMKPVLAAVGAGMIPAAMAAAIPIMMGRKKRSVKAEIIPVDHYPHHVRSIPRSLVNYAPGPFSLDKLQRTRL